MAKSAIDVINKALISVGANIITSLDEGSTEATTAGAVWDQVRQSALRLHPWNFASKDLELAQVTGGGDVEHEYQYNLPSDFIRLLKVYDDPTYKLKDGSVFTNYPSCRIRYIFDSTDPVKWDSAFVDVVAYKLATEIAYALTKSTSLMQSMQALYEDSARKARAFDASEDIPDLIAPFDSPFISVRF